MFGQAIVFPKYQLLATKREFGMNYGAKLRKALPNRFQI